MAETAQPSPAHWNPPKPGFLEDFKRFFRRGAAALLPTLITLLLLLKIWEFLWDYLGQYIISVLATAHSRLLPEKPVGLIRWQWWDHHPRLIQLLGVSLAILLVYIVGLIVGNFIGRTTWRLAERGLMRIPLIRAIYTAVKQVTDFILADRSSRFSRSSVVAIEPHANGIWSIGLVTGSGVRALSDKLSSETVTVFVPSSPTAFSGYVLVVRRECVVELPMTVEEAMRLLVTGGVVNPESLRAGGSPPRPATAEEPLPLAGSGGTAQASGRTLA